MNNTEMIIAGNFGGNNNITLYNYFSTGAQLPTQNISIYNWNITGYSNSSGIFVNFTRLLTTGQPNDEVLYTGLESPFSYAYYSEKTSVLVRHNNAVQGNIVFGSTTATSSYSLYYTPNSLFNLSPYFSIGWTFISNQTIEFFLSVIVM